MVSTIPLSILEKKLEKIRSISYIPEALIDFLSTIIILQNNIQITLPELPKTKITREEFLNGKAYFTPTEFIYDKKATAELFGKLLSLLEHNERYKQAIILLRKSIEDGTFSLHMACRAYLEEDEAFFEPWIKKLSSTPHVLLFLLRSSLHPSITACAQKIQDTYSIENWAMQTCPCCGTVPYIACHKEIEGKQYNVCFFCSTEYRAQRIECPYCQDAEYTQITYVTAEEIPRYILQICENCKSYFKISDRKELFTPFIPALEDFESIALDSIAQEKGYNRPVLCAWGF
ncbi:MAG: formate dehydrogenase accessory protein FdhE [Desulfovibrionaceae bacterium]